MAQLSNPEEGRRYYEHHPPPDEGVNDLEWNRPGAFWQGQSGQILRRICESTICGAAGWDFLSDGHWKRPEVPASITYRIEYCPPLQRVRRNGGQSAAD